MINPENKILLGHLDRIGVLQNLDLFVVTNGTHIDPELVDLMAKGKSLTFNLSVDGVGEVQEYIRFGKAPISRIEEFLAAFHGKESVFFQLTCSVMVYNIFSLSEVAGWWNRMRDRFGNMIRVPVEFSLHVIEPGYLSVSVLSEELRQRLLAQYRSLQNGDYEPVIQWLSQPGASAQVHNDFLRFTKLMDQYRGTSVLEVVPELTEEFVEWPPTDPKFSQSALIQLDQLIEGGYEEASMLFKRGLLRRETGDLEGAFQDLSKAARHDPDLFHLIPEHWWI